MNVEKCPFCGGIHEHMRSFGENSRCMHGEFVCDAYGAVAISEKAIDKIFQSSLIRTRIKSLLREKSIKDRLELNIRRNVICSGEIKDKLLEKMILVVADKEDLRIRPAYPQYTLEQILKRYPVAITDKLNRAIGNIGRLQSSCHDDIPSGPHSPVDPACFFAEANSDFSYFAAMLTKSGWCSEPRLLREGQPSMLISLTFKGWQKFEELERSWQNSNTAFIAMWFDDSTKAYREAVRQAMNLAGYDEPVFIDTYQHNNFIMDEVINKINDARFVVADFTCLPEKTEDDGKITGGVRGGVYFEAGYARGLGKEVIMTCKNSDEAKKRRHFDIDQVNTLFWDENGGKLSVGEDDFIKRLVWRIKATVGRGKNPLRD